MAVSTDLGMRLEIADIRSWNQDQTCGYTSVMVAMNTMHVKPSISTPR